MKITRKRIEWIDVAKGISIILMLIGHYMPFSYATKFIFSFHMPIFIILSGYTHHLPQNFIEYKKNITKYAKRLLIPYVITLLIMYSIFYLKIEQLTLLQIVKELVWGNGCSYNLLGTEFLGIGPIWFLMALFFGKAIYDLIYLLFKKEDSIVIMMFILLFGIKLGQSIWLPLSLDLALVFVFFLYCGQLLKRNEMWFKKYSKYIFVISLVTWILLLDSDLWIELAMRSYPNTILTIICALSGSFCVMELCKEFSKIDLLKRIFTFFGSNSLDLLCIHTITSNSVMGFSILPMSILNVVNTLPVSLMVLSRLSIDIIFLTAYLLLKRMFQILKRKNETKNLIVN